MQMQPYCAQGTYPNLMEAHCNLIEIQHQQFKKNQIRKGIKCRLVGTVTALNTTIQIPPFYHLNILVFTVSLSKSFISSCSRNLILFSKPKYESLVFYQVIFQSVQLHETFWYLILWDNDAVYAFQINIFNGFFPSLPCPPSLMIFYIMNHLNLKLVKTFKSYQAETEIAWLCKIALFWEPYWNHKIKGSASLLFQTQLEASQCG